MQDTVAQVAVIGAGLAGISAAITLSASDLPATLFSADLPVGGRLGGAGHVDLGAQYFTARHPAFRLASREWQERGWVAEWSPDLYLYDDEHGLRPSADDVQRLVALPRMNALAGHLVHGLRLQHARIVSLRRTTDDQWFLNSGEGAEYGPFSAVIIATLPDAATDLLSVAPQLQQDVARVRMRPCWTVDLQFAQPLNTPVEACFVRSGPLDWLCRDSSKPQRAAGERWVLQSTASWAEQHADASQEQVISELAMAMARVTGLNLPEPIATTAFFWSQARPAEQLKWGALAAPRLSLYVCGDWCLGGRVENAWLSGRQAAQALLGQ